MLLIIEGDKYAVMYKLANKLGPRKVEQLGLKPNMKYEKSMLDDHKDSDVVQLS